MVDILGTKSRLHQLVDEINKDAGYNKVRFHQQRVRKAHMSIEGRNGRLTVKPTQKGWDLGLSGQSLEKEMYEYMCRLTGKQKHDKFGFPNRQAMPIWEVNDLKLVDKAVRHYSKT